MNEPTEPRHPTGMPTNRYEYENECFFGNKRVWVVLHGKTRGLKGLEPLDW